MNCAVITCSEYKRKMFKGKYMPERLTFSNINAGILVINLPYSTDKFYLLGTKKKTRLCEKLCACLHENNIYCVYLSGITDCEEFALIKKSFYIPNGKAVVKSYIGKALFEFNKKCETKADGEDEASVLVWQKNFSYSGLEIIYSLSHFFKNISVAGCSDTDGEKYAEKIMDMTGLCLNYVRDVSQFDSCDFFVTDKETCDAVKSAYTVDLTKTRGSALKRMKFYAPPEFNRLLVYFCVFDDVCLEFLIYASAENLNTDILKAASQLGFKFKSLF